MLLLDRFCSGVGGAFELKYSGEHRCYPQEVEREVSVQTDSLWAAAGKGEQIIHT